MVTSLYYLSSSFINITLLGLIYLDMFNFAKYPSMEY